MSSFTYLLITYFRNYNIWFLSILIILGCLGIPTGASLVVIASGAFAYAGEFNIVILLLEIWFFSCAGDSIAYIMWKVIGHKFLNKSLRVKTYFEPKIKKAQNYLKKHGKGAIFFTRFLISAMGPFVNAAAGITEYKLATFCLFVALGELLWSCIYLELGYWFGDSWESIVPLVTQIGEFLTYITILIIAIYFFIKMIRKNKRKR
ncbi:DedA family protein [Clostridium sp. OS1-26]|uniref:DedA family protein n=1 Tax=Clostridium sp. OS1-26 TaxID=3070681 RepID=UPI0027E0D55C|nr:DedA family protein [Clostridium sp. OS1-26]WML33649.1 DedA family protein [Clostridium sp. OS1-26]